MFLNRDSTFLVLASRSAINEVLYGDTFHLRGEPSLKVNALLTTDNPDLSPVIDLGRTAVHTEKNLIDRPNTDNIIFGLTPKTVVYETPFNDQVFNVDDEIHIDDVEGVDSHCKSSGSQSSHW